MLIAYFDEVKPEDAIQPYFWLGGLMFSEAALPVAEREVDALAEECFGQAERSKRTEFHATDVCSGSRNFRRWRDPGRRFDVLKRLVHVIDQPDGIFRVVVRLDVRRIDEKIDHEALAFIYFVERINQFAKARKTHVLMIGDFEREVIVNRSVENLAGYRRNGTLYAFGQRIGNVVDTVHFAYSHHSRLLQLADTYMWIKQLLGRQEPLADLRAEFAAFVRKQTDISWEHKYKYWPPVQT